MAVSAASSHPVLAATAFTLVVDTAQLAGTAAGDQTEHFAVAERNVVAKLLQVLRCVLPQGIRNGGQGYRSR